jgi:DNA-binding XRE family transcriptional regulator
LFADLAVIVGVYATEWVTIDLEAGGRMELAVRESDAVDSARQTLGLKLAMCRRANGYSQADFASLIDYTRSTVANVETGRQHVPPHILRGSRCGSAHGWCAH